MYKWKRMQTRYAITCTTLAPHVARLICQTPAEDCYFDHTGEAYARPSRAEIVPQQSAKQSFHDHASTGIEADVAEAVSRVLDVNSQRFDNGLTSSALSSGDGPQVVRYETGLIKRLDALQRSAMDRFQKDQNLFMERKIKKRINELWGDHKDSQKVLISEVFNHFNQDKKDGLYPRIKRMVDAKVEAVMNKDAERQSQNLRNALDEFETRLTRLEATLSVLQHDMQSAVTEDKLEEIGNRIAALEATMQKSLQYTSNPEATSTPPSVTRPSNVATGPGKPLHNMEGSSHQSSIDLPSTQSPIPAKADIASKSTEAPPSRQYPTDPTDKTIPSNAARPNSSMLL